METFRDVISRWPTVPSMGVDAGVGERTAFSWWQRDSIPADRFAAIIRAARLRGYEGVTAERLAEIAEKRRLRRDAEAEAAAA